MNRAKEKCFKMCHFHIQDYLVWQNKRQNKEEAFVGCPFFYPIQSFTTKQRDFCYSLGSTGSRRPVSSLLSRLGSEQLALPALHPTSHQAVYLLIFKLVHLSSPSLFRQANWHRFTLHTYHFNLCSGCTERQQVPRGQGLCCFALHFVPSAYSGM